MTSSRSLRCRRATRPSVSVAALLPSAPSALFFSARLQQSRESRAIMGWGWRRPVGLGCGLRVTRCRCLIVVHFSPSRVRSVRRIAGRHGTAWHNRGTRAPRAALYERRRGAARLQVRGGFRPAGRPGGVRRRRRKASAPSLLRRWRANLPHWHWHCSCAPTRTPSPTPTRLGCSAACASARHVRSSRRVASHPIPSGTALN